MNKIITLITGYCLLFVSLTKSQTVTETTGLNDTINSQNGKRIYFTQQLTGKTPAIDGNLDDNCWKQGYWAGNYKQWMPKEGAQPTKETNFKILYDSENIYVAIRAFDDPEKVDHQRGRRDYFRGDIVGVCFDSYHDNRTGFEFDLTAAGSKIDLILLNKGFDTNWDPVWYGKVGQNDTCWTAEMKIPLSQLRFAQKENHVWGLHAWRWINRNHEEDQWNLIPRDNPGLLYSIGELHGISGIEKKRRIEFLPYILGKVYTYEKENENPFDDGYKLNGSIGLDGKIGISSNFTLDYTINPDFGQVEADPAQLNLTAYETFFDEKRPFFLEGKNIFDFDFGHDALFYSRRIGSSPTYSPDLNDDEFTDIPENTSIIGAAKVSGKNSNGLSIGVLEALTAREKVTIKSTDEKRKETVEPLSNYFVARLQKDINKSNTIIGGIITGTNRNIKNDYLNFMDKNAYTGGLDIKHHWREKTYYIDAKFVFSNVIGSAEAITGLQEASARYYQRPDADYKSLDSTSTALNGYGTRLAVGKGSNGRWRFEESLYLKSPGLELNDLGFQHKADYILHASEVGYEYDEPVSIFRSFSIWAGQENSFNFGATHQGSVVWGNLRAMFANKWGAHARLIRVFDSFDADLLRGGPKVRIGGFWCNNYGFYTDASKKLSFRFNYHFHLYDDKKSKEDDFYPSITYRISNTIQISTDFQYSISKDILQYVPLDEYFTDEKPYLLARLQRKTTGLTLRTDFTITPEFTIQYYANAYLSSGQYTNYKEVINPDADNYDDLYTLLLDEQISYDTENDMFMVNNQGETDHEYQFENPDFNYQQFRSNLVARWEVKPGSVLYLVWTNGKKQRETTNNYSLQHGVKQLFEIYPENVFLIKFSYWLNI